MNGRVIQGHWDCFVYREGRYSSILKEKYSLLNLSDFILSDFSVSLLTSFNWFYKDAVGGQVMKHHQGSDLISNLPG